MKNFYLMLLLVPMAIGVNCSTSNAQTSRLYFDHFDVKKGLLAGGVYEMKEDAEGYIWLASLIGFVRYDGYRFKVYGLRSPERNISFTTSVVSIFIDKPNARRVGLEGTVKIPLT